MIEPTHNALVGPLPLPLSPLAAVTIAQCPVLAFCYCLNVNNGLRRINLRDYASSEHLPYQVYLFIY